MKVRSLMSPEVFSCRADDTLESAARLLWEQDCGSLPVVDALGHVRAVITDRDICMAAYVTGRPLGELRVADSMSPRLVVASPDDDVATAAKDMSEHAVRRLPVVDGDGKPCGLLSLNDLARAGRATSKAALAVLAAVSQPRFARPSATASPSPAPRRKTADQVLRPTASTKSRRKATEKPSRSSSRGKA